MRILALATALIVMLLAATASGASAAGPKCGKKQAVLKTKKGAKCVKRCPRGFSKKRVRGKRQCVRRAGPQDPGAGGKPDGGGPTDPGGGTTDPGGGTTDPGGGTTDPGGGTTDPGAGTTNPGAGTPDPAPQQPAFDPAAQFADIVSRMYLLRNYQVPKPGGGGFNNHSESYAFCNDTSFGRRARHYYEGIAYIYDSNGPWSVASGTATRDGSSGEGTIQYTQENANFPDEVGKVQTIQIAWQGDVATVAHPEIGTNQFAKSVSSSASCTRTS